MNNVYRKFRCKTQIDSQYQTVAFCERFYNLAEAKESIIFVREKVKTKRAKWQNYERIRKSDENAIE